MALTSSDFLSLHSQHNIPDIVDDSNSDYDAEKKPTTAQWLLETWKQGQKCLSQFWTLWNNEYMLSLSERVPRKPDCHLIARPPSWRSCIDKGQTTMWFGRWAKFSELIVVEEGFKVRASR